MTPLEKFLQDVHEIRSSHAAVDETPYYGSLEVLLNEVGKTLKPRVRCIIHPKNKGAGLPDGGLFTAEQFDKKSGEQPKEGQLPSRGAMEVKPPSEDGVKVALSEQVTRYVTRYRQVLVTNLRQFALVGLDADGRPTILEKYELADSEAEFWKMTVRPKACETAYGPRLMEYLRRVMLHAAPLAGPEDVAPFLASYARDALFRIGSRDLPALAAVRKALEEALGIQFDGDKGEHFFRSTLVQTLFYGVFSAWVLWAKQRSASAKESFDWKLTAFFLRVSVLRKLFHEVADPGQLLELNLSEVLDWTTSVLNRVDRASFFSRFQEAHAVQYFYEPFLEAFDPELRKELGVWYTPPEIVEYMVARVDAVLREELGLADGLADKNVYVLDPCCGTGSYLVAVLKRIHQTLKQRGEDAFLASDLKEAAQKRVFGFELLPAPFVVSHLQLGLLLQNFGAPLTEKGGDRVGVYLTNALTGWELRDQPPLVWPEMEAERAGAGSVKRETAILVVLGNPPYNGFAGVAVEEERDLTVAYKTTKLAPAPQGQGLNDLYVRFYRMAEHRIAEMTGKGVICFISNYSWLNGLSFPGMREDYLEKFDRIWVDSLNGDKFKTGKLTPDGKPDPSVFSTEWNHEGIQVGTAIGLLARRRPSNGSTAIRFRHLWGKTKREQLLDSLSRDTNSLYEEIKPVLELGLPFMPTQFSRGYSTWPLLTDLLPVSFPGVKTSRDDLVVDIDRFRLIKRMRHYFDPEVSHEEMRRLTPDAMENTKQFDAEKTRDTLRTRGFLAQNVIPYLYRPFDLRSLYWEPETDLLDRKREEYFPQIFDGNVWIEARQKQTMENFDRGYFVRVMADNFGNGLSSFFPLYLVDPDRNESLLRGQKERERHKNLSPKAEEYLTRRKLSEESLFYHIISILNDPLYRAENAGALCQDWPRVVLPESADDLRASAELGRQVAELLDAESALRDVERTEPRPELRLLGVAKSAGGGSLTTADLPVTGWGHAGKGGATMPGKGKTVEREYSPAESKAILEGSKTLGLTGEQALAILGCSTVDVYLNEVAYCSNIPQKVWDYTIGGYQVIKKWLSYREEKLLGRTLSIDEVRYVQGMVRRIAAILLLESALDANYREVKSKAFPWPS
jgi:Type ISP C-terminal specificity domain/N-6 DNA Methylase